MSNSGDRNEIVPFRYNAWDLNIDFLVPSESNLSLNHLKGISNAWQRGAGIDSYGRIWICQSELHTILRTTKDVARYLLLEISETYQLEVEGKTYVQGSEVSRLLDTIIQSAGSIRKEKYARYSEEVYKYIRDDNKVKLVRAEYYETIQDYKRQLKKTRITQLKLTEDELTGLPLDKEKSEFSHIRNAKIYLHLADKYWNGLVVNKETHAIITRKAINDEDQLYSLCINSEWNTEWYSTFSTCLRNAG